VAELETYRGKRHFDKTPEPSGTPAGDAAPAQPAATFVIQKHAARALHYDLRLEMNGVLVSWAVPKGPSYDTHDKRLAVHVEDHPLEYGSFEGVIPPGEYGAGTVMVWDRGTWEPIGDLTADEMMAKGHVKFTLHGEKLEGGWALVRMKPREGEKRDNWLLIKERDDAVRPHDEYDVLQARPESAASGRDMDQITAEESAAAEAAEAGNAPSSAAVAAGREVVEHAAADLSETAFAEAGPMPQDAPMQLARLVERPPEGDEWLHEVKYDGYRIRLEAEGGRVRMLTRNGQDWRDRFPQVAEAAAALPVESALLDGEAVVFGTSGVPDFGALQHAIAKKRTQPVVYMAFDLLYLNGFDLRQAPLVKRKELLKALVSAAPRDIPVRYTDHIRGRGVDFHREACTLALEGSVSKLAERPYVPGRTDEWRKVKCLMRQEFVVGGFTEGEGSREGFGALLLGTYDDEGGLRYAGRVGTGFTDADLRAIRARLDELEVDAPPFVEAPGGLRRLTHWVRPELVAEVSFQEWTRDGVIRQPSFHGLREDKPARQVLGEAAEGAGGGEGGAAEGAGGGEGATVTVAGVGVTKPNKVLFEPKDGSSAGVTKLDLARYYERVAGHMLPWVERRPLTMVRCPHGAARNCFYQKHPEGKGFPKSLGLVTIEDRDGPAVYVYPESPTSLVALAQHGVLEIHTWNSHAEDPERPDQIVFDLDPGPGLDWFDVRDAATFVRDALAALGLTAFAKTTGGKGLHLVVPIEPDALYDDVRALAQAFVQRIAAHDPKAFTSKMAKSTRTGRVFIDYLRNAHGATAIAPFSTRARGGAPVAVPVTWAELEAGLDPGEFDIRTVPERLDNLAEDPWASFDETRAPLTDALFAALGLPRQGRLDE